MIPDFLSMLDVFCPACRNKPAGHCRPQGQPDPELCYWCAVAQKKRAAAKRRRRAHNLRVLRVDHHERGDLIITLGNGARYRGQSTVWHRYPDGERAPTQLEAYLSDVWTREQWKR
jgi:hypothetical protein